MLQLDYERKRCMPLCQLALVLVQLSCLRLLISDLIMKHLQRNKAQPAEIMALQKGTVFILILCLTLPASRLVTGEQVRSMLTIRNHAATYCCTLALNRLLRSAHLKPIARLFLSGKSNRQA